MLNKESDIPLYKQLEDLILKQVRDGSLKPGDKIESIRSMAQRHELSIATVQRVVTHLIQQGILGSQKGRGVFVLSQSTQNRSILSSRTIALLSSYSIPEMQSNRGFFGQILKGIYTSTYKHQKDLLCLAPPTGGAWDNPLSIDVARQRDLAGILAFSYNEKELRCLNSLDIPTIIIDYDMTSAGLDSVVFDNRKTSFEITQKLLGEGCEKISFVGYAHRSKSGKYVVADESVWERFAGVKQAIREFGLPEYENQFLNITASEHGTKDVIDQILASDTLPDAIIGHTAGQMITIAKELYKIDPSYLDKILFAGIAGEEHTELKKYIKFYTTADGEALASQAVELMMWRLENRDEPTQKRVVAMDILQN